MIKGTSSRLGRNIKKNNKRTVILSLLAFFLFCILLLRGFPYILEGIGNISQFLNRNDSKSISQQKNEEILLPPTLIDIPQATSSAYIKVSGKSEQTGTIEIYLNTKLEDEIESEAGKKFTSSLFKLKDGPNEIRTKIKNESSESSFSESYNVSFLSKEPILEVSFPQDSSKFLKADKRITIQGKTDENSTVFINDTKAIVDSDGSFSHLIELNEGDNQITIRSRNQAGKELEKKITVNYSRE